MWYRWLKIIYCMFLRRSYFFVKWTAKFHPFKDFSFFILNLINHPHITLTCWLFFFWIQNPHSKIQIISDYWISILIYGFLHTAYCLLVSQPPYFPTLQSSKLPTPYCFLLIVLPLYQLILDICNSSLYFYSLSYVCWERSICKIE